MCKSNNEIIKNYTKLTKEIALNYKYAISFLFFKGKIAQKSIKKLVWLKIQIVYNIVYTSAQGDAYYVCG